MEDADIGYALMPEYRGKGYACEASAGVLDYARSSLGMKRVAAITAPDNEASANLLRKLGLREEDLIPLGGYRGKGTSVRDPIRLEA